MLVLVLALLGLLLLFGCHCQDGDDGHDDEDDHDDETFIEMSDAALLIAVGVAGVV